MADSAPGRELQRAMEEAAEDALPRIGGALLGESLPRVPLDEGGLRESGHVESGRDERGAPYADVIYNRPHAAAQHEGHAIQHRDGKQVEWTARVYSQPGTGANFLLGPLAELAPRFERALGAAIERRLAGRG